MWGAQEATFFSLHQNNKSVLVFRFWVENTGNTFFTIAWIWKQPKCPSRDEWIVKMRYIRNGILFRHRKKGSPALCDIMNGP